MKKVFSMAMVLAFLMATMAGCGVPASSSSSVPAQSPASGTATAEPQVVTLKISHNMDFVTIPDSVIAAADQLNKRYQEEGKNITVKFETDYQRIDWTEYHNNVVFAQKSGSGADIFSLDSDVFGFVKAGMLLDISDVMSDAFVDGIFTPFMVDGKAYGMPFDMPLRVMYYNKGGLKKIGWSDEDIAALPQKIAKGEFTFEQFLALAQEVQQKGGCKYGLAHRPGGGSDFFDILQTLGGQYYDESGKLVFDEAGIKRFFQNIYDNANVTKITPPDLNQMGWDTINKMVGNGDAFAYYGPLYSCTYVAKSVSKTAEQLVEDVDFALFPVSEFNTKPFATTAPQGMGISASTKYPEICKDLFVELSKGSSSQLANHAAKILTLSSVKDANTSEIVTTNPVLKQVTYMADYAITPPTIQGINTYSTEMHKQIIQLELGQTTPEKAVADFKIQVELNVDKDSVIFK